MLRRLLSELGRQQTQERFTFSIVVVDNDSRESARPVTLEFAQGSSIPVKYCLEAKQNIALARNKAIATAKGDYVAFIDDDEFPTTNWLLTLFQACQRYNVDGVLGPVKPHFDTKPPVWIVKGKFYDRPSYPTGLVIDWRKGRTGNVLLKSDLFKRDDQPFKPEFITGEDQDFFRRMINLGRVFVWCEEAVAFETVPPVRWKRSFMLRRALLRGKVSLAHPTSGILEISKSVIALPVYALALPLLFLVGHHHFMKYLVKSFDHAGKLLASLGIKVGSANYITD